MSIRRFVTGIGVLAATLGLTVALTAAPAQAETDAYTPQDVCGYDYWELASHRLSGATVYLMYNGSYNCATTIKTSSIGIRTQTSVSLQVAGSNWVVDTGPFTHYAGPVKQYGRGKCVRYYGYHGGTSYYSPWGFCG